MRILHIKGCPAHAERNLALPIIVIPLLWLPRTRRAEPENGLWSMRVDLAAPHTQSGTGAVAVGHCGVAGCPAHAERNPRPTTSFRVSVWLPRTRRTETVYIWSGLHRNNDKRSNDHRMRKIESATIAVVCGIGLAILAACGASDQNQVANTFEDTFTPSSFFQYTKSENDKQPERVKKMGGGYATPNNPTPRCWNHRGQHHL